MALIFSKSGKSSNGNQERTTPQVVLFSNEASTIEKASAPIFKAAGDSFTKESYSPKADLANLRILRQEQYKRLQEFQNLKGPASRLK